MYRAKDFSRDQSYFLFSTTQDQLDFLRFPLGDIEKTETRDIAISLVSVFSISPKGNLKKSS